MLSHDACPLYVVVLFACVVLLQTAQCALLQSGLLLAAGESVQHLHHAAAESEGQRHRGV